MIRRVLTLLYITVNEDAVFGDEAVKNGLRIRLLHPNHRNGRGINQYDGKGYHNNKNEDADRNIARSSLVLQHHTRHPFQ